MRRALEPCSLASEPASRAWDDRRSKRCGVRSVQSVEASQQARPTPGAARPATCVARSFFCSCRALIFCTRLHSLNPLFAGRERAVSRPARCARPSLRHRLLKRPTLHTVSAHSSVISWPSCRLCAAITSCPARPSLPVAVPA